MNASRFPGKVLADMAGRPAIERMVDRVKRCELVDEVVIATTTSPGDEAIVNWARDAGVAHFRGSEDDVLRRVVDAQRAHGADIVVELCGDCPLSDPGMIDLGIKMFLEADCEIVSSARAPSWPAGIDVQVFRLHHLEEVERSVSDPAVREHVSLYFYEHPERYRCVDLLAPERYRHPEWRLLLDYPEDLVLLSEIQRRVEPRAGKAFGIEPVVELLEREPALLDINRHCIDKPVR